MIPEKSQRVRDLEEKLLAFMEEHIYPNEARFYRESEELGPWGVQPVVEELKPLARAAGLWNLFLPESGYGAGLTNLEYAPLCEIMGRSPSGAGGLQLLGARYRQHGSAGALRHEEQQERWLEPLLAGEIRSSFAMTEPDVASSRCHQYRELDRARRRRVRHQRPQMVHVRRRPIRAARSSSSWARPTRQRRRYHQQSMILVPQGHAGRHGHALRSPCSASTACPIARLKSSSRTCGCRPRTCCSAKAAVSRSRRGASGRAGSIIACA